MTRDNNLENKIKKGDMSVEAITDTLHEYKTQKKKQKSNVWIEKETIKNPKKKTNQIQKGRMHPIRRTKLEQTT